MCQTFSSGFRCEHEETDPKRYPCQPGANSQVMEDVYMATGEDYCKKCKNEQEKKLQEQRSLAISVGLASAAWLVLISWLFPKGQWWQ